MKKALFFVFSSLLFHFSYAQNLKSTQYEYWQNDAWQNHSIRNHTVDAEGKEISTLIKTFEANAWQDAYMYNTTYTTTDSIGGTTTLSWNATTHGWDSMMKTFYTYGSNGRLSNSTAYFRVDGKWTNFTLLSYVYDGSDYLTVLTIEHGNATSSAWKNNSRHLYTNNENGTVAQYLEQKWIDSTGTWQNMQKTDYTYAPNFTRPVSSIRANYYDANWHPELHVKNSYDANVDSSLWYLPHLTPSNSSLFVTTKNSNGKPLTQVRFTWNNTINDWTASDRYTYTYEFPSGIAEAGRQLFACYPNPAKNALTLTLDNPAASIIQVKDLQGRLVLSEKGTGQTLHVDISNLSPALYTLSVEQEGAINVSKFIKH